ncbi:MAG: ferrous iron transport protein A [Clostridia bacterium]|nr:ferrous iron transport protein A [Clostridia bacterium]
MEGLYSLADARPGQRNVIVTMAVSGVLQARLREMGVIEGTEIVCVQASFFGDPRIYRVRGTKLCLRREEARRILCRPVSES